MILGKIRSCILGTTVGGALLTKGIGERAYTTAVLILVFFLSESNFTRVELALFRLPLKTAMSMAHTSLTPQLA